MSDVVDKTVRTRRAIVRAALIALYLALAAFVFTNGKGHTLLLDNKSLPDGSVKSLSIVEVYADKAPVVELLPRDRDMAFVTGQRHRIRIETPDGVAVKEVSFTVPLKEDMILVSIPKLAAGIEPFWEPFRTAPTPPPADEALPPPPDAPIPLETPAVP